MVIIFLQKALKPVRIYAMLCIYKGGGDMWYRDKDSKLQDVCI